VNDQYISDYIYTQNDNQEPRKIPTVINGCVSETRNHIIVSKNKDVDLDLEELCELRHMAVHPRVERGYECLDSETGT
jgi:hypothetical protein